MTQDQYLKVISSSKVEVHIGFSYFRKIGPGLFCCTLRLPNLLCKETSFRIVVLKCFGLRTPVCSY